MNAGELAFYRLEKYSWNICLLFLVIVKIFVFQLGFLFLVPFFTVHAKFFLATLAFAPIPSYLFSR